MMTNQLSFASCCRARFRILWIGWLGLGLGLPSFAGRQPLSYFTPSYFDFNQPNYAIVQTETNLIVTILRTGDFREEAWVTFSTADGSAKAGMDYLPVNQQLYFPGGVGFMKVNIPIHPDPAAPASATILMNLSDPSPNDVVMTAQEAATLTAPAANPPLLPKLSVRAGANQTLTITWPATADPYVLEQADAAQNAPWRAVSSAPQRSGSEWTVTQPRSNSRKFFRLRKN